MNLAEHIKEIPIPSDCGESYKGMAFDGCHYYFLVAGCCKIIKTNPSFMPCHCYKTTREYNCICYDFCEHCFWAAAKKCCNKIFKLDCCLREIDFIKIQGGKETTSGITGISYNCCNNSLLITFAKALIEYDKASGKINLKHKICYGCLTGVLAIPPGYIATVLRNNQQIVYLLDDSDQIITSQCLPQFNVLKTLIFNPCSQSCHCFPVLTIDTLIIKKGCYPYILKTPVNSNCLGFCPHPCNYQICGNSCEEQAKPQEACNDVIESVALMEAALSHILNAEGEKLQKVLASTDDIEKILCVNKEINKTIINATHLEHALYAKLSTITDYCKADDCDSYNNSDCHETCDSHNNSDCHENCDCHETCDSHDSYDCHDSCDCHDSYNNSDCHETCNSYNSCNCHNQADNNQIEEYFLAETTNITYNAATNDEEICHEDNTCNPNPIDQISENNWFADEENFC